MIRQLSTPDLVMFVEAYEHYLSSITMKALSRFGDKAIEKKRKRCIEVLNTAKNELAERAAKSEA